MPYRVTIIDAYDSFVHILAGYFEILGCQVTVLRKDHPALLDHVAPAVCDMVVLGPGPGHPTDSGYSRILSQNAGRLPVLGVCLGHQAIGLHFGSSLGYATHLMHGKTSLITHDGKSCFASYGSQPFRAMRYHSIYIEDEYFSPELIVTARSDQDNYIMGIRHKTLPIEGVQFHPESIGTEAGISIVQNFIQTYVAPQGETNDTKQYAGIV